MFSAQVWHTGVDLRVDPLDGNLFYTLRAPRSDLAWQYHFHVRAFLVSIVEPLVQRIYCQSHPVDIHVNHFFWRDSIAVSAESKFDPAVMPLLVIFWLLSGIVNVLYCLQGVLSLADVGAQVLHVFEPASASSVC